MKLELKHITPYLPYDLQVKCYDNVWSVEGFRKGVSLFLMDDSVLTSADLSDVKPILRPLSSMSKKEAYDLLSLVVFDLTVDIEDMENLIIKRDLNEIIIKCTFKNSIYYDTLFSLYISGERILYTSTDNDGEEPLLTSYSMYEHLFSNHFDVFGLIDRGLAIEGL